MRRAWVTPVGLVLAVAALAPACGGDEGDQAVVAPVEWATTVCTEVGAATTGLEESLTVIDELPAEVEADAPLGEQAAVLRRAFLALPAFVERYLAVVEGTPAPDTADGVTFRDELLADLRAAEATFGQAADAAEDLDADTTVEDFFTGAQAFAGFPEAFAAADLAFEDPPPGVDEAMAEASICDTTQGRLVNVLD